MKRLSGVVLFVAFAFGHSLPGQDLPLEERRAAEKLIRALKAGDKAAIAKLVNYPLNRQQPLPPIRNEQEFIDNYAEFFDTETIQQVLAGENDMFYGWRGLAIGPGLVWIDGGKIRAITIATSHQKEAAQAAKKQVQATLHPSARGYDQVLLSCKTKSYQIRIHQDAGKVLYFSWKASQPLSAKPDITLNGEERPDGQGGNETFIFKNGDYRYEVDRTVLCGNNCDSHLTVFRGTQTLLDEVCVEN
jgi:hypothetical protein